MTEQEPRKQPSSHEKIAVPLRGPNIVTSLESPPPPAAVKVHQAVVRKHIIEQQTHSEH
jgi:hypothetical protein